MSNERKEDFDPRFNPAFQRGFADGADGAATAEPDANWRADEPALVHPSAPSPARASSPIAGAARLPVDARPTPGADAADTDNGTDAVTQVEHYPDGEYIAAPEPASVRNPFLVALAAVAVLLVAVGGWVFSQARAGFDDTANIQSQGDFLSLQAMIAAGPSIMLLGVATGIGVLFMFAARWRRR